ncbi:hypothetical protein DRP53_07880 [candidate division WOR-3 bacterium]|uniref:Amidohydrolase-related domain-containing protein n=1 Tax=candidate division WOR-3 bacterium TaxID=2052148 RepID=A0A660SFG8_UNCW3|nr:MAG: hypothetical protein DRP53_07880 [candidate division WOR-3 bacterium]
MIIDGHTHIGPWRGYFQEIEGKMGELIRIMDQNGIDRAVVFRSNGITNEELLRLIDQTRFYFFWWASKGDNFQKFSEAISGIKIHPTIENLRADQFHNHLQFASEKKIPVLIHCGRYHPISSYRYALNVARTHPIPTIFAHMGGARPDIALAAIAEAKSLSNIYFGIEGIVEPWLLKRGIGLLGPERFIFGSDFPISHPRLYLDLVDLVVAGPDRELILGGNLMSILP